MGDILVIIEHQDGEAKKASAETLTAAKAIADSLQGEVAAIALGPGAAATAAFAGKYGASRFYHATADNYSPDAWADLLATHIGENGYAAVCIAATSFGRDLLPHVSARCLRPTAQDVIAYDVSGGDLLLTRPVYAGKARTTVRFSQEPAFFSLRPNSVEAQEYGASAVSSELSESVSGGKVYLRKFSVRRVASSTLPRPILLYRAGAAWVGQRTGILSKTSQQPSVPLTEHLARLSMRVGVRIASRLGKLEKPFPRKCTWRLVFQERFSISRG
jgi:electron transfer flavoprotein alpha subunit